MHAQPHPRHQRAPCARAPPQGLELTPARPHQVQLCLWSAPGTLGAQAFPPPPQAPELWGHETSSPRSPRGQQPGSARIASEILEHANSLFCHWRTAGMAALLIVRVHHVDLPAACGLDKRERKAALGGRAPPPRRGRPGRSGVDRADSSFSPPSGTLSGCRDPLGDKDPGRGSGSPGSDPESTEDTEPGAARRARGNSMRNSQARGTGRWGPRKQLLPGNTNFPKTFISELTISSV